MISVRKDRPSPIKWGRTLILDERFKKGTYIICTNRQDCIACVCVAEGNCQLSGGPLLFVKINSQQSSLSNYFEILATRKKSAAISRFLWAKKGFRRKLPRGEMERGLRTSYSFSLRIGAEGRDFLP